MRARSNASSALLSPKQNLFFGDNNNDLEKFKPALKKWYSNTLVHNSKIPRFVERLNELISLVKAMALDDHIGPQPRQTWTDGIRHDEFDDNTYALRLIFILICSKRSRDQSLDSLHPLINSDDFCIDWVIDQGPQQLAGKIKSIGFQNINANAIFSAFTQIQVVFGGRVPMKADLLSRLHGVGNKIACLVTQYAFDSVQVIIM